MKKHSVMAIFPGRTRTPGACEIYRAIIPLNCLAEQAGWLCQWTWFDDLSERFAKYGLKGLLQLVGQSELIIIPRLYTTDEREAIGLATVYSYLRAAGKRLVYETDDDYTNLHRDVIPGTAALAAQWSDAITVTTPYLADTMRRNMTKRKVYVLPNVVDQREWSRSETPARSSELDGKITIALTGSPTHKNDWSVLETVMPRILAENPNVHFILMGYQPDYLKNLPNTTFVPAVDYDKGYPYIIRISDIILCPVDPEDGFNDGKSDIKAVEGMAARRVLPSGENAGAAVIATGNKVYRLSISHEKNGLLTEHNPEAWYNAITRLIHDTELRKNLQVRGHKWVLNNRTIQTRWTDWESAYSRILRTPASQEMPYKKYIDPSLLATPS